MINLDQRQVITSWWIFHKQDSVSSDKVTPEMIRIWMDEAETDLQGCNAILAQNYDEYVPQL